MQNYGNKVPLVFPFTEFRSGKKSCEGRVLTLSRPWHRAAQVWRLNSVDNGLNIYSNFLAGVNPGIFITVSTIQQKCWLGGRITEWRPGLALLLE